VKVYQGIRMKEGCIVTVRDGQSASRPLDPCFDVRRHSPTGFEWGYTGSGPAQLALALTTDVLGDSEKAQHLYQDFKFKVVARLPHDGWTLTQDEITGQLLRLQASRGPALE
jgi:hypothetical protein